MARFQIIHCSSSPYYLSRC